MNLFISQTIFLTLLMGIFQIDLYAQSKTDTAQNAVVAADHMNILYMGLENPITVAVPGVSQEFITLKCSDGADVRQTSLGHFVAVIYPNAPPEVTITTLVQGVPRGNTIFRIMPTPKATLKFGKSLGGKISVKNIYNLDSLYFEFASDFIFNGYSYKVSKYTLTYTTKLKDSLGNDSIATLKYIESGAGVSDRIKEQFAKAKKGDQIVVGDIQTTSLLRPYMWAKEILFDVTD